MSRDVAIDLPLLDNRHCANRRSLVRSARDLRIGTGRIDTGMVTRMVDFRRWGGRGGALAVLLLGLPLGACGIAGSTYDYVTAPAALAAHPEPAAADGVKVMILPFVGVPVTTGDEIYRRMRGLATKQSIKLALRLDEPATYRVRGYLSALGSGASTMVVFRIDIHDASGRRVHQFIGQETAPASAGDPWSGVDRTAEDHVAQRILDGIKAWITRDGA